MYNVCEVMFDVPEDTRTSCNLPSLGAALRVAARPQTFAPGTYSVPDDFEVCATVGSLTPVSKQTSMKLGQVFLHDLLSYL